MSSNDSLWTRSQQEEPWRSLPCKVTLPNCGFTTMKFSDKPALRSSCPRAPPNAFVLLMKLARAPTSPLAIQMFVVAYRRKASEPVSDAPFTVPTPGTLSPFNIRSKSGAFPPARLMLTDSWRRGNGVLACWWASARTANPVNQFVKIMCPDQHEKPSLSIK